MVEINNYDDLERWLRNRPREDAVVIAARAALRVLPLLVTARGKDAEARRAIWVLPVFRAMAAPWVAAVEPTERAEVWGAAYAAANPANANAANAHPAAYAAAYANAAAYAAVNPAATSAAAAANTAANGGGTTTGNVANAVWGSVSVDATALEKDASAERVETLPLWPEDPPVWAADAWARLEDHLLKADEGWEVWTNWYEDRLHGRPFDKALEEARVLIPDEIWEQGPEAVNTEIARLIIEHAERATPQGERLVIRRETGQIGVEPAPVSDEGGWDNACDKVRDRYQRLIARGLDNQFSALRPVIDDLEQAFSGHRENPRRMHDTFATGVRNIAALLDANEVPDDLLVVNLQKDMADGVLDIREAVPEVKRMAEARAMATMTLPPESTIRAVDLLLAEAGEAFEPDLGAEIEGDNNRLGQEAEKSPDPDAPLPDGEPKDRAYRLFGRLARLLRMARAPDGEIWAALEVREALGRLMDLLNGVEVFWAIIRWLIM